MTILYVPRAFGGTLIIVTTQAGAIVPTMLVPALFRSGEATATFRNGEVQAGGR